MAVLVLFVVVMATSGSSEAASAETGDGVMAQELSQLNEPPDSQVPSTTVPAGATPPDEEYDRIAERIADSLPSVDPGADPPALDLPPLPVEPYVERGPAVLTPPRHELPALPKEETGGATARSATDYYSNYAHMAPNPLVSGTYNVDYWFYLSPPQNYESINCDDDPACFWFAPVFLYTNATGAVLHTGPMHGESRSGSTEGAWKINVSGYPSGGAHEGTISDLTVPESTWVRLRVWREATWTDSWAPYTQWSRWGVWAYVNGTDDKAGEFTMEGRSISRAQLVVEIFETNSACDTDFTRAYFNNPAYRNTAGGPYPFPSATADYSTDPCGTDDAAWLNMDGDDRTRNERDVQRVVVQDKTLWSSLPRMQITNESATYPTVNHDFEIGAFADVPTPGDWNGDGSDTPGVWRPSKAAFYTRASNEQGALSGPYYYGDYGDKGIVGDWDGDGDDEWGVYRPGNQTFYLYGQSSIPYGNPGDLPLVGDWDNDGVDEIGVYRPGNRRFYRYGFSGYIMYGNAGDVPIAGNWNAAGGDEIGVYRPSLRRFYLRYSSSDTQERRLGWYGVTPTPIVGDWNDNGRDTVGVWRP